MGFGTPSFSTHTRASFICFMVRCLSRKIILGSTKRVPLTAWLRAWSELTTPCTFTCAAYMGATFA